LLRFRLTSKISHAIRVLGVTIDQCLTFNEHVTTVVSSCNYHIRSLRHSRHLTDCDTANNIATSIVATRLDYCNVVLYGITGKNIMRLQRVQNSLARVVCAAPFRSPSDPLLRSLHWLPVRHRITHTVATLTFKALNHHQPTYLYELLSTYSPNRRLRSSPAGLLSKPVTSSKTSDRAFAVAAPTTWNRLPQKVRTATTTVQFSRALKTHLFNLD